jgi:hypothetical protein
MTTRQASCCCGQLRIIVQGDPVRVSMCHCLECQKRTGTVFGAQARFPNEAIAIEGQRVEYVRIGDEGGRACFRFCPQCGSTVYYTIDDMPGVTAIPVGAFADPTFPAPWVSVYEDRKHPWVSLPHSIVEHWG